MSFKHIVFILAFSIPFAASASGWEKGISNWHYTQSTAVDMAKTKARNKVKRQCGSVRSGTWVYSGEDGSNCSYRTQSGKTQYKCEVAAAAECR